MKCLSCKEQISPKFVAAIRDNICPACGNDMMSQTNYKRIFEVERQLKGLGFDKNLMFGVAAALASRFTLVPRDLALVEGEDVDTESEIAEEDMVRQTSRKKPNRNKRSAKVRRAIKEQVREEEDLQDLPEELREEIIESYGMNLGDKENVALNNSDFETVDNELVEALYDMPLEGSMSGGGAGGPVMVDAAGAGARHQALLARAEQAKMRNPGIQRLS